MFQMKKHFTILYASLYPINNPIKVHISNPYYQKLCYLNKLYLSHYSKLCMHLYIIVRIVYGVGRKHLTESIA